MPEPSWEDPFGRELLGGVGEAPEDREEMIEEAVAA